VHAGRGAEHLDDVMGRDRGERRQGERRARVVVERQDLDGRSIAKRPMRGVGLPELVGQLRFESDEG
jgi:hypothetical protein